MSQSYDLGDFMSTSTTEELQGSTSLKAFNADHIQVLEKPVRSKGLCGLYHFFYEILDKASYQAKILDVPFLICPPRLLLSKLIKCCNGMIFVLSVNPMTPHVNSLKEQDMAILVIHLLTLTNFVILITSRRILSRLVLLHGHLGGT